MDTEARIAESAEQPAAPAAPASARPSAPWTLKDMAWASVAALMFTGLGIVMALALAALFHLLAGGGDDWNLTPYILMALAFEALLLVPAWVWGPVKYGGGWKALGFRRFHVLQSIVLLALAVVVIIVVNVGWEWIRQGLGLPGQPDMSPVFGDGIGGLLMALLLGGVVAPVAEEVFFRGYIQAGLRSRWGARWGLVASSLLFAGVHLSPATLPPLFVMGLVLGYLYERTDSLWPSILLHAANNSIAFIALFVTTQI